MFTGWKYDISSFNHRGLPNKLSKINSGTFLTIHGHKQKQSTGNVKCRKTVKLLTFERIEQNQNDGVTTDVVDAKY